MSNAWFFEKFELIADLPDAVSRMRELVLELAVQGRLVEQDSNDATVLVLLQDLKKASAAETLKAVDSEQLQTKRPFEIPETWAWASLNSLGTISGGHTPSTNIQSYWNGSINWFTSKDIKQLELYDSELKITEDAIQRTGLKLYPSGSVVIVGRSGILKRTLPVAIIRNPSTVNQDLKVIQPTFAGMEKYIQVMLRGMTSYILKKLVKTGTTVQSLKYDEFFDFPFPLPPLSEQRRIVAKVEELMGICDRLELEQRERESSQRVLVRSSLQRFSEEASVENLGYLFHRSYTVSPSDLRKTILTLAVQGKLVPQDPEEGSAEELVKRIFENFDHKSHRDPNLEIVDEPINICDCLPDRWKLCRFDEIAEIASNLVKPEDFPDFIHVAPDNIQKGTGVLLRCQKVKEDKVVSSKHRFGPGQILYSKIRPNLSKVVIVDFEGLCSADMYPINARIDAEYLKLFMLSDLFLQQAVKTDTRVAMPKINQSELNAILILVPPLAEQRRIVAKVEELMSMVDELEEMEKQATDRGSSLLDAIVHELAATAG